MKKYLMIGASALAAGALLTSCSHDDVSVAEYYEKVYEQKFLEAFGPVNSSQDWGFSSISQARMTRAITVNGDTYDAFPFPSSEELAAAFPTAIPADADEVAGLLDKYKGQTVPTEWGTTTLWDIYAIYANVIKEGYNLKITQAGVTELGGNYQNAGWDGAAGKNIARPYNVYVDVDGDVTIRRVGATHFNLYILRGNVTLESNYGEQAGLISVAPGATLNDQRNSIAANQGVQIFNRGTINATNPEKYDIGNFCKVYNQGKFYVTGALTYSPGDGNNSYFVNFSDEAELTAPSMTLNSTGNFYNDGRVVIDGATNVTQARLYWVNAGHYTTGAMNFSAKNSTFYNYCQLIVRGNAHMYDGEFNLMQNSYTEAGTAEMDNFIVNMGSNTGMNIKGDVDLKAQGDGTFQGFRTSGTNDYLLIGGKVTVASHRLTFSITTGITYSINNLEIVKSGSVVTEEYLQSIGDGDYPVLDFKGTECPYGQLTVTPNANSCGATWTTGTTPEPTPQPEPEPEPEPTPTPTPNVQSIRIMAEDLSVTDATDLDFNDVVFDVTANFPDGVESVNVVTVKVWAAGGTLPLKINSTNGNGGFEVHNALQVDDVKTMINTNAQAFAKTANGVTYKWADDINAYETTITLPSGAISKSTFLEDVNEYVRIEVEKTPGNWALLSARRGMPACKIAVPVGTPWAMEKRNMNNAFSQFKNWVNNNNPSNWYASKVNAHIYNKGTSTIKGDF